MGCCPVQVTARRLALTFDFDTPRQILGVVEHFKKQGHNPLASGFRLKPIFEELPAGTDSKIAYSIIRSVGGFSPTHGRQTMGAVPYPT